MSRSSYQHCKRTNTDTDIETGPKLPGPGGIDRGEGHVNLSLNKLSECVGSVWSFLRRFSSLYTLYFALCGKVLSYSAVLLSLHFLVVDHRVQARKRLRAMTCAMNGSPCIQLHAVA